jgi:hypothetical protein
MTIYFSILQIIKIAGLIFFTLFLAIDCMPQISYFVKRLLHFAVYRHRHGPVGVQILRISWNPGVVMKIFLGRCQNLHRETSCKLHARLTAYV